MSQIWARRLLAGMAGISLITCLGLVNGPKASAQPLDLHYSCQSVVAYVFPGRVNGLTCTGPLGTEWGTITDARYGTTYYCQVLTGSMLGNLEIAGGSQCTLFGS